MEYGISDVTYGADNKPSKTVSFGDGKNRVLSVSFDDGTRGVAIVRDEDIKPFERETFKEGTTGDDFSGEKVYLLFDNNKSIDAVINQLIYVRDNLSDQASDDD